MHNIPPFFRSPFTDITSGIVSHQLLGRCAKHDIDMMNCIEAYGVDRGIKRCQELIEDFKECHTLSKQFKKFMDLRRERDRQIEMEKMFGDKKYLSPKLDTY